MPMLPHTFSEVLMRAFSLSMCLLLSVAPAMHAQAAPAANPLHWGPAPAVFPMGARMAEVSGDPSKAALCTGELAMPSGYKIAPHFHTTEETVAVKKGTLLGGKGGCFAAAQAKRRKAG